MHASNDQQSSRHLFRFLGLLSTVFAAAISILLLSLWLDGKAEVTLPTPTGTFAVGRAVQDWTDPVSIDPLAPQPGTKRELLVWIWYPARSPSSANSHDYLPAQVREPVESDRGPLIKLLTHDLAKVRAQSVPNLGVSTRQRSYSVVIMRSGASLAVWNYSTLAEDLASHGWVVVGFDAPYRSRIVVFPDGRVIRRLPQNDPERCLDLPAKEQERCAGKVLSAWTSDTAFVLDRLTALNASDPAGLFTGRLDMSRIGVFGHSFGGATAAQFCREDSRCKAGVDVDGALHGSVIEGGLREAFMFLLSDHSGEYDPQANQVMANMQSVYAHLPPNGRAFVEIRGASHFLFTDDGALLKSGIVMKALRTLGIVHLDGRRQLAVTAYCLRRFLDETLNGGRASNLKIPSIQYPELKTLE